MTDPLNRADHMVRGKGTHVKIEPLFDRVLVRRTKGAEKTPAGIIIPETAREAMGEGEVVAVGPGRVRPPLFVDVKDLSVEDSVRVLLALKESAGTMVVPLTVQPGQRVLFAATAGTPLELNRVDHVLLREEDILGIVSDLAPGDQVSVPGAKADEEA